MGGYFLAEQNPINTESESSSSAPLDFATLDSIPDEPRVLTSTRYQFNIFSLVRYHNERSCKDDQGEDHNFKQLRNPYTKATFIARDVVQLQACAKKHGLMFQNLGPQEFKVSPVFPIAAQSASNPSMPVPVSPPSSLEMDDNSDSEEEKTTPHPSFIPDTPLMEDKKRQLVILRGLRRGEIKATPILMSEARFGGNYNLSPTQTASLETREALFGNPGWLETKNSELLAALSSNPQIAQQMDELKLKIQTRLNTIKDKKLLTQTTPAQSIVLEHTETETPEAPERHCRIL